VLKHYTMKTVEGNGGNALHNLTSTLDGGEWSTSLPDKEPQVPTEMVKRSAPAN